MPNIFFNHILEKKLEHKGLNTPNLLKNAKKTLKKPAFQSHKNEKVEKKNQIRLEVIHMRHQ